MQQLKALIIYHANCADGFTAAWIAEGVLSQDMDTTLYAATHGESVPLDEVDQDTRVYILDFSYDWEGMLALCDAAASVVLLDHHESAVVRLAKFEHPNLVKVLDMDRSGAGMTWDWFFPNKARPDLVNRVEDRDLWRFKYPDSKEVAEAIFSRHYSMEEWDQMAEMDIEELAQEGVAIKRKKDKDILEFATTHMHWIHVGNYEVPACNIPYFYASEMGHFLLSVWPLAPFAVTYFNTTGGERQFSFRSENDRVNVSKIAMLLGGGGHRNAAGCKVPFSALLEDGVSLHLPGGITFGEEEGEILE